MHPYRPRISFQHVRELWGFSIWMLVGHVSAYAQSRVDQIALGGVADSTRLGQYTVAMDVATLPTIELALPAARALYPTYSRLSGDLAELKKAFVMTLGAVAAICWSAGVGVALVSHDFVAVLLGSQWLSVIPIVPWLALSGALFALSNTVFTVHQATGRARTFALQAWMRVVIMAPLVIYAAQSGDLQRLAQAQFLASAVFTPIIFASLRPIIGLTAMDVIRANIRPAISAGMMWVVVPRAIEALSFLPPVARLFVSVGIGGAVFVATMLVLWYMAGRPMGVESSTLVTLSKGWRRMRVTP